MNRAEWKERLRLQFEACLQDLEQDEEDPGPAENPAERPETPDLYSFYALWAASQAEARKANRRLAEALSQWGELANRLESERQSRGENGESVSSFADPEPDRNSERATRFLMAEFGDRLRRIGRAFQNAPPKSWWSRDAAWKEAWGNQRQALEILAEHFEVLLQRQGLRRIETLGRIFDPEEMTATETECHTDLEPHLVLEETAPGYYWDEELLRPAQVKVNSLK